MNLSNNTNTSFKGIPYEPSIEALHNLQKEHKKFADNFLKYYSALKKSDTVDFFIKEENGKIVDAYTQIKKPIDVDFDILKPGTQIRPCAAPASYANGTLTLPTKGNVIHYELGEGGLPKHIAEDAISFAGESYFDNNPAIAYILDLHNKLQNIFKL